MSLGEGETPGMAYARRMPPRGVTVTDGRSGITYRREWGPGGGRATERICQIWRALDKAAAAAACGARFPNRRLKGGGGSPSGSGQLCGLWVTDARVKRSAQRALDISLAPPWRPIDGAAGMLWAIFALPLPGSAPGVLFCFGPGVIVS